MDYIDYIDYIDYRDYTNHTYYVNYVNYIDYIYYKDYREFIDYIKDTNYVTYINYSTDFFFCPPIFATLDLILTFIQQSKAFGAIAPSSVAFQLQLELFSNTKGPKLRK